MSSLYELLKQKENVSILKKEIDKLPSVEPLEKKIESLQKKMKKYQDEIEKHTHFLEENLANIDSMFAQLNQKINTKASELIEKNQEHFSSMLPPPAEQFPAVDEATIKLVLTKLAGYSDWHYPALYHFPRYQRFVDSLVASDPLYLTGTEELVLQTFITKFPELYQRRVRLYEVKNKDFSQLPQAQFGLVVMWDYFNYLPLSEIDIYLEQVYALLRPGGTFFFSFNNCDLPTSAKWAESMAESYYTEQYLRKKIFEIGYNITSITNLENSRGRYTSWAEIRKPGKLHSLKAFQALATIERK